jgi:hypothetical protein
VRNDERMLGDGRVPRSASATKTACGVAGLRTPRGPNQYAAMADEAQGTAPTPMEGESANCQQNFVCPNIFSPNVRARLRHGRASVPHQPRGAAQAGVCIPSAPRPPPAAHPARVSTVTSFDCPRARPFSSPPSPPSLPAPAPPADRRSPRLPVRAAPEPPGPARRGSVRHRALRRDCRSMGAPEVRSRRPCLAHSWRARARGRRRPFPPPYPADVCGDSPVSPPARPYPSSAHAASPTTTYPTSGRGRPAPSSPHHRRPQRRPQRRRTEALARAAALLLRAGRGRRTVCGVAAAPPRRLR